MRARTSAGSSPSSGTGKRLSRGLTSATSVGVDPGLLDERAPFLDLGLEVLLQGGRRGLVGRVGGRAEVGEALLHRRVLDRFLQGGHQLVEDRLLQALGAVQAVPDADLEALEALLLQ